MRIELFKGKFESFDVGRIKRLRDQNDKFVLNLKRKIASDVQRRAMDATPVHTGEARKSIKVVREGKNFRIEATAEHYKYIEFGRKGFSAFKRGQVFVFKTKQGKTIFTTEVRPVAGKFIFRDLTKLVKQGGFTRRAASWAFKRSFD